uniref:Uncharacterized protein n=1 Tax=viral metagenome TaxID=1070528 RepID=A0A6C0DLY1_9ZZZZ
MSVSKQLAMNFSVHGVFLPIEVIDIIKSFTFEDRIVASVKKQMKDIVKAIDGATISRKNSCRYVDDTTESWEFRICDNKTSQFLSIKSMNCRVCGGYSPLCNDTFVCNCPQNDDEDEDMYYDEGDDDDPWHWQY